MSITTIIAEAVQQFRLTEGKPVIAKSVQLPELDESVQTRLFPAFQPVDNIYKSFVISSDATKGFEVIGIDTGTHHGWFKSEADAKKFIDTKFPNSKNLPNYGSDSRSRYSSRG